MSVPYPNWDPPTPSSSSECVPPPNQRGRGHNRLRVRGWGVPTRLLEKKPCTLSILWCTLYKVNTGAFHFISYKRKTLPQTWPWFLFPYLNFNLWAHKTNCNWLNDLLAYIFAYIRIYMFPWGFGILSLLDIVFSVFLQSVPQITGKLEKFDFVFNFL